MQLSVIIPVYNSGKYITRCLDSIVKQSFNDFEVIIVDDGSVDNSKDIIKKYVCTDSRIKYFYIENSGVSYARNYGINRVSGEYLMFVDADDYCNHNYFKKMISLIQSLDVDVAMCNYYLVRKNNDIYANKLPKLFNGIGVLNLEDATNSILLDNGFKGFVWNKIYSMNAVGSQRFDVSITYLEDLLFNILIFKNSNKIGYSNDKSYYYCQNKGSASSQLNQDFYSVLLKIRKLVSLNNRRVVDSNMFYSLIVSNNTKSEIFETIKTENNFNNLKMHNPIKNLISNVGFFSPISGTLLANIFKVILSSNIYAKIRNLL